MSSNRRGSAALASCLGALLLGVLSPTSVWPAAKVRLIDCRTGKSLPDADTRYDTFSMALEKGLTCLRNNPNTPQRAKALDKAIHPFFGAFTAYVNCDATQMNLSPSKWATRCGQTRPGFGGAIVQFPPHWDSCGCVEGNIFHESIHATSSLSECPSYGCAHACFSCAPEPPDFPPVTLQSQWQRLGVLVAGSMAEI